MDTSNAWVDGLSLEQCQRWLSVLPTKRIAVIGDVMLDHYYVGSVSRISPEAPVPVVELERQTWRLGGAANVAHNLRMLGAHVVLCGVVGDDSGGAQIRELAVQHGIEPSGIVTDRTRPTTIKSRIIGNNQQLLRLDHEQRSPIGSDVLEQILAVLDATPQLAAVIFEDYNKGVLHQRSIPQLVEWAQEHSIPILVDPKLENFFAYRGATLFKPNQKEASYALGTPLESHDDILRAGRMLLERLQARNVLITLGSRGMMLLDSSNRWWQIPSVARHVADVSGAGDTVIATVTAMMVAGAPILEAAAIANIAASVVCGEPGVVPITTASLLAALAFHMHPADPRAEALPSRQ
jgi:rfaE bifunctional protein kinase chain/domain